MLWRGIELSTFDVPTLGEWIERLNGERAVIQAEIDRRIQSAEVGDLPSDPHHALPPFDALERPEDQEESPPTDREETIREGIRKADLLTDRGEPEGGGSTRPTGGYPPAGARREGKESL